MFKLKGIDISEFNGEIDFKKVKNEVDFIYIRATYGRYGIDKKFREYTEECIKNEIPFGLYYYSYAIDEETAKEEVTSFLRIIKSYKELVTFPLMIDMEDSDSYKKNHGDPSKEVLTDICKVACEEIIKEKYSPIIYASADWFKNRLDENELSKYMKWIAWWGIEDKIEEKIDIKKYSILQYSSKGKIEGIKTNVDLDYSFIDFISLKEYILNLSKFNFIKSKTFLSDFDLQFLSSYKWNKDLINKIFIGLQKEKINPTSKDRYKVVQKFFCLEDKTLNFMKLYCHEDELFQKLYNSITISSQTINITE